MKTLQADTLAAQTNNNIDLIEQIILYQQHPGKIKSSVRLTTRSRFTIDGDATSFISVNDYCTFPLYSFGVEYKVLSISYNSSTNETRIETNKFASAPGDNTYIAKKIDITDKLTMNGIKGASTSIEGRYLGEFDSGDMSIVVSNDSGYFQNKNGTGLFDNGYDFWIKYMIKIKGTSDNVNFFGGVVDMPEIVPDVYNKTLTLNVLGHSYELGRYPSYDIFKEGDGNLPRINGLLVTGFNPSDESEEGIKTINFTPFNLAKMNGINIELVSIGSLSGIKLFEFHYPNQFRWDNGDWVTITANPIPNSDPTNPGHYPLPFPESDDSPEVGKIKLWDADGSPNGQYALLQVGDDENLFEFPDQDIELWVDVKDEANIKSFNKIIENQGEPTLTFDNGLPSKIKSYFQLVLAGYTGMPYNDVTQFHNDVSQSVVMFILNGSSLTLVSPDRFWGAYFDMTILSTLGIGYTVHYSIGGDEFSADISSIVTDSTNGFKQSGFIKWSDIPTWAINNITPSASTQYKGYMIKFIKTSGSEVETPSAKQIQVMNRAQGEKGDFLEFRIEKVGLRRESTTDSLVIKNDVDGWKWGVWPSNMTTVNLLDKILDRSYYTSSKRELADLEIETVEKTFNIWGTPPRSFYPFKPTAMFVDYVNTTIYIATDWEVWSATFTGEWEKVFDLNTQGLTQTSINKDRIRKITKLDNVIYVVVLDEDLKDGLTCKTFTYDTSTGVITKLGEQDNIYTGQWHARTGMEYITQTGLVAGVIGGKINTGLGSTYGDRWNGEQLCFAYRQRVYCDRYDKGIAIYPAPAVDEVAGGFPEWYFSEFFNYIGAVGDPNGPFYNTQQGYFKAQDNSLSGSTPLPFNVTFQFGSAGCFLIYSDFTVNLVSFKKQLSGSEVYYSLSNLVSGSVYSPYIMRNRIGDIPCAHASTPLGYILWAFTQYRDVISETGLPETGNIKHYSYLTKAQTTTIDWKKVLELSAFGIEKDMTVIVNSGVNVNNILSKDGYELLFGHDKKFKNIHLNLTQPTTNVYTYYYSAVGDTWIENSTLMRPIDSHNLTLDDYLIDMPDDWVAHSTYGFAIKVKITTGATVHLVSLKPTEVVLWDSQNEAADDQRIQIVNMGFDSTNNVVMGCCFNRDSNGAYPFQWSLFTFDISTETMTIIRQATNYTFEGSYVYKDFTFNSDDGLMYATANNIRYKDEAGFLIAMDWNLGTTLVNKVGYPGQNDWGFVDGMSFDDGKLFGLTYGEENTLFELSNSYAPRIQLVEYDEQSSLNTIIGDLAMMMNHYYMITSDRLIRFKKRDDIAGTQFELVWDVNMVTSKPIFKFWNNFYDAITVGWKNLLDGTRGNRKTGFDGWMRNSYTLNNPLIQNKHIAKILVDVYKEFFSTYRIKPEKIKTPLLQQLEVMDGLGIYMPPEIGDIDTSLNYVVTGIELTSTKQLIIKCLERKI